jgi:hypothetical protein
VLVEPVGPVDVDAIWLFMESIRYIDSMNRYEEELDKLIFSSVLFHCRSISENCYVHRKQLHQSFA